MQKEINITPPIKQGCTVSTTLFKLATYIIINELNTPCTGFKDEHFTIQTLFYADDGMSLSQSVDDDK